MHSLLHALRFLTIFPVGQNRTSSSHALRYAWGWFPFIGLWLCVAVGCTFSALSGAGKPMLGATLTVVGLLVLTRGLHHDGFADMTDAAFGGSTKDERLRIMKDPHIGTFAVLALIAVVLVEIQMLTILPPERGIAVLGMAGLLSRWASLWPLLWLPRARETGLMQVFQKNTWQYVLVTLITMTLACIVLGYVGLLMGVVAFMIAAGIGAHAVEKCGGITGDVCGATIVLTEVSVIAGYSFLTHVLM